MRKHQVASIILTILYILVLAGFTYLSLSSGSSSSKTSGFVSNTIASFLNLFRPENDKIVIDEQFHHIVRKLVGHFGYFVLIGIISACFYIVVLDKLSIHTRIGIHFITGFLFAFISEFWFQAVAEARGPSFTDVLIDYSGFFISAIGIFIYVIVRKKRYGREEY